MNQSEKSQWLETRRRILRRDSIKQDQVASGSIRISRSQPAIRSNQETGAVWQQTHLQTGSISVAQSANDGDRKLNSAHCASQTHAGHAQQHR